MNRILIIRPSAIGDVVMASPMLKVLRQTYPDAYLAWLVEPQVADLLRSNSDLDEIILFPKGRWKDLLRRRRLLTLLREVREFVGRLRQKRFDLALDGQGLFRSRLLALLSGARERLGFDSREPGRFLMTRVISRGPKSQRMSSEYFHLMEVMGMQPGEFRPDIAVSAEDQNVAENLLNEAGLKKYAIFSPFTTRPQKHWFEDRWAVLAGEIDQSLGLPVVILGGPGDAAGSRRIGSLASARVYDFTGKTTLGQAAAIINMSALVIGVDTGLTHLGTAFARPTVALFGATCPYLVTSSPFTRVLYDALPCSPCRRNPTCNGEYPCMKTITAQQVVQASRELLAGTGTGE